MKLDTIEKVLDFAIQKEQDASDFYMSLAAKMSHQHMKQIFEQFSKEELGHKAKLMGVKQGKLPELTPDKNIMDLKIAEGLTDVNLDAELDYQQALIAAMKAEKAAYKLYSDLAAMTKEPHIVDLLNGLAQEEAKHKLRFEIEYDEQILKDN